MSDYSKIKLGFLDNLRVSYRKWRAERALDKRREKDPNAGFDYDYVGAIKKEVLDEKIARLKARDAKRAARQQGTPELPAREKPAVEKAADEPRKANPIERYTLTEAQKKEIQQQAEQQKIEEVVAILEEIESQHMAGTDQPGRWNERQQPLFDGMMAKYGEALIGKGMDVYNREKELKSGADRLPFQEQRGVQREIASNADLRSKLADVRYHPEKRSDFPEITDTQLKMYAKMQQTARVDKRLQEVRFAQER